MRKRKIGGVSMSVTYDVTSPDGRIGIVVTAEERAQYITGTRLWIDVYKEGTRVAEIRVSYAEDLDTGKWFDIVSIDSKEVVQGQNYNELRVTATDTDDGITVVLVVRVYNDMVAWRFENIPNGVQTIGDVIEGLENDTFLVPGLWDSNGIESEMIKDVLGNLADSYVPRRAFAINLTKKWAVLQLTVTKVMYSMLVRAADADPSKRNLRFNIYPYPASNPTKANITETDWIALIFFTRLDDIRKVIESHISDFVTVKTFDRTIVRALLTWYWYKADIDESKVRAMIDKAVDMKATHLIIDDGWQVGKSAVDIDTSKFPNGLSPLIDCAHQQGLGMGIHVHFEGIVNAGVDNAVNTWLSWGLGEGDIIKIGFVKEYIDSTGDNYGAIQTLRYLIDVLWRNGMLVSIHEFRSYALAFEYQNIVGIETDWEFPARGSIYNIVEKVMRYVDTHDVDTDGYWYQGQNQIPLPTATLFAAMLYTQMASLSLDEWDSLDEETKDLVRRLIQEKDLVDTVEIYDNYIVAKSSSVVAVTAFSDVTVNIDVPFRALKITTGSGGTGLVKEVVDPGTYSISLAANDSVIFVEAPTKIPTRITLRIEPL